MERNRDDNQLIVTFYDWDNKVLKREYVDMCGSATPPKDPVRNGYVFESWVGKWENVVCNENVYPSYVQEKYSATFLNADGVMISAALYFYGEYAKEPPIKPTVPGKVFTGWDKPLGPIVENTVFHPIFDATTVKVTFIDTIDGSVIDEQIIPAGSTVVEDDPTHTGYVFVGWDKPLDNILEDTIINAIWKDNSDEIFTITWMYKDKPSEDFKVGYTSSANGGTLFPELDKPSLNPEGYTIVGWSLDPESGEPVSEDYAIYGDTTFYAILDIKQIRVEFECFGDIISSSQYEYGESIVIPDPTEKEGCTFICWEPEVSEIAIEDVTYVAKYDSEKHTVIWMNANGDVIRQKEYNLGDKIKQSDIPVVDVDFDEPEGKKFLRWDKDVEIVDKDYIITAVYTGDLVVRFLDNHDKVLKIYEGVNRGSYCEAPIVHFSEEGYPFVGWDNNAYLDVQESCDIHAIYDDRETYKIDFLQDDKSTIVKTVFVKAGETPECDITPTKKADAEFSYSFAGWDPAIVPATKSTSYVATYDKIPVPAEKFKVEWLNYDGTALCEPEEYTKGDTPVYSGKTPERAKDALYYYVFNGWKPVIKPVTRDTKYTAVFVAKEREDIFYTIKFVNYNDQLLQELSVKRNEKPVYTEATPTKPKDDLYKYKFASWSPSIVAATEDATYKATFTRSERDDLEYTIRFLNDDDSVLKTYSVKKGEKPVYTGSTPTKEKTAQYTYTFKGWTPTIVAATEDADYKATYTSTKRKYTVRFLNADGTVLDSGSWEYGSTPSTTKTPKTPAPVKGYKQVFDKWSPAIAKVTKDADYTATFKNGDLIDVKFVFVNYDSKTIFQSGTVKYGGTPKYTGTTPKRPDAGTKTYTFAGWDPEVGPIKAATTYTAQFDEKTKDITLTFVDGSDGKTITTKVVQAGHKMVAGDYPTAPIHSGKAADKWDIVAGTTVSKDTKITLSYKEIFTWSNGAVDHLFTAGGTKLTKTPYGTINVKLNS